MARRNLYPSLSVLHREYIASSFSPPSFLWSFRCSIRLLHFEWTFCILCSL